MKKLRKNEKKIDAYVYKVAKRYLKDMIKDYIERKGISRNYWKTKDKLSFKSKYQKLEFNQEEVDVMLCANIVELTQLYLNLGLEDHIYWIRKLNEWYADAVHSVNSSKQQDKNDPASILDFIHQDVIIKPSKKLDFSNIKV